MIRRVLVGALVAAAVIGAIFLVVRRDEAPRVSGLAPAGEDPFGSSDTLEGAVGGLYNADGTRLAVFTPDGLGLAERGRVRPITGRATNVVDAAWFGNGATLLVAEGPTPTGGLAVVDIDGRVRTTVPLDPVIGFGSGHGMSVAPGGRAAVVTAVERPALGAEQRHLVLVDLGTGTTRTLTTPGGPDETGPFHLDARRVAYTEHAEGGGPTRARVIDLETGAVAEVASDSTVVGVIGSDVVVEAPDRRLALTGPGGRLLAAVPDGATVATIDPGGRAFVVVRAVDQPTGERSVRLRRLPLDPPREG